MGSLTREELNSRRPTWAFAGIDKSIGLCLSKKNQQTGKVIPQAVAAIEGYFMGIDTHEYEFKGKQKKVFDVFLKDDKDPLKMYRLQVGFYTYYAWTILNKMLSVSKELTVGEHWIISCSEESNNDIWNLFLEKSGTQLKQKFTREKDKEILGFKDGNDDKTKATNCDIRDKHINKWFSVISEIAKFDKNSIGQYTPTIATVETQGESVENLSNEMYDGNFDSESELWDNEPPY